MPLHEPLTDLDRYNAAIETAADLIKENLELKRLQRERDNAYAATDVWVKRVEEVEGALHRARSLLRRAVGAGIDDQWLKDARKALQAKP
jgi:hypothetical protein